ncbi:hypothetical protein B0H13DRAFT_1132850 [Mycena leptocephala]|nr:hypothetical protein B0H13DRAFT_1132850 [Mycena leptocephala]
MKQGGHSASKPIPSDNVRAQERQIFPEKKEGKKKIGANKLAQGAFWGLGFFASRMHFSFLFLLYLQDHVDWDSTSARSLHRLTPRVACIPAHLRDGRGVDGGQGRGVDTSGCVRSFSFGGRRVERVFRERRIVVEGRAEDYTSQSIYSHIQSVFPDLDYCHSQSWKQTSLLVSENGFSAHRY